MFAVRLYAVCSVSVPYIFRPIESEYGTLKSKHAVLN
jgi:hypothetical protein